MNSQNTQKYVVQPLMTGAVCAAGVYVIYGNDLLPFMGKEAVVAPLAIGAAAIVADIGGTVLTDYISENNEFQSLDEFQKMAVKPLVSGLVMVAASNKMIAGSNMKNMAKLFAFGAGSSVGGAYVADMINSLK